MQKRWKVAVMLVSMGLWGCSNASTPDTANNSQKDKDKVESAERLSGAQKAPDIEEIKQIQGKLILGQKEWVSFPSVDKSYRARVDTGATTSSLSAYDLKVFERNGEKWVRFKIKDKDSLSDELVLPVKRWVRIRQASNEEGERRPVIETWLKIGDKVEKTEFTLADRSHLSFPVLLGRSYIEDFALVDVSRRYIQGRQ
jgi:hypothetical protein